MDHSLKSELKTHLLCKYSKELAKIIGLTEFGTSLTNRRVAIEKSVTLERKADRYIEGVE